MGTAFLRAFSERLLARAPALPAVDEAVARGAWNLCLLVGLAILVGYLARARPRSRKRRRSSDLRWWRRFLFFIVGIIVVAAVAEVVSLTIFDPRPPELAEREERYPGLFTYVPGSDKSIAVPSQDWPRHWTRISRGGFRGTDVSVAREPNSLRVIVLGDELTFGTGLADDETLPSRLAESLAGRTKRTVEVLNFGVEGWNLWSSMRLFEEQGTVYRPDIVLLVYSGESDLLPDINARLYAVTRGGEWQLPEAVRRFALVRHVAYFIDESRYESDRHAVPALVRSFAETGADTPWVAARKAEVVSFITACESAGSRPVLVSTGPPPGASDAAPADRFVGALFAPHGIATTSLAVDEEDPRFAGRLKIPETDLPTPFAAAHYARTLASFVAETFPEMF